MWKRKAKTKEVSGSLRGPLDSFVMTPVKMPLTSNAPGTSLSVSPEALSLSPDSLSPPPAPVVMQGASQLMLTPGSTRVQSASSVSTLSQESGGISVIPLVSSTLLEEAKGFLLPYIT